MPNTNRTLWIAGLSALALLVAARALRKGMPPYELGMHTPMVEAQSKAAAYGADAGPRVGNCPVLPADSIWNTPIDKLPKDSHADAYIDSIGPAKKMHPDFGSNLESGIPYSEIPAGTRPLHVTFENTDESDPGTYAIPPDAPVEGGPHGGGGDRHIILVDGQRCLLYELYAVSQQGDSWSAGSGIKIDLTDNALRAAGKTSADAAGLPIFPGLLRYDEVAQGEIRHALRFTVVHTQRAYVWPARHYASASTDVTRVPMGARFRLRADFDISKYSKTNQVIMTALKRYGMFMADNGTDMYLSGVSDKRWDDSDLHKLGDMKAEDFEAVDESGLQLLPDSGRVDPVAFKRLTH